jgi:tetratricopeptide (TPR) repeat protein
VPSGPAIAADRYSYISSIGVFYIVGAAIFCLYSKKFKKNFLRAVVSVFLVFIITGLLFLTRERCKVWHDSITLWSDAIAKFPYASLPYRARGPAYAEQGDFEKAILDYRRTVYLDSNQIMSYDDIGNDFVSIGKFELAFFSYGRALQIDPKDAKAYNNRAVAYFLKKEYNLAWADVHNAEYFGYDVDPNFLEDLKKLSGRQE